MPKPKKADPVAVLAELMLRALEAQRQEGAGAYPPTLRRLAARAGGGPSDAVRAAGKKSFTARAVVPRKVDKKPALDSPVYFKEDAPKPDPAGDLANLLLLGLEEQKRLGADAYPPTLQRLAELSAPKTPKALIPKAASHPTFSARAVAAAEKPKGKPAPDAPVVFREDLAAVRPALLRFALRPVTVSAKKRKVETHAFAVPEILKRFVPAIQEVVGPWLRDGIERGALPAVVAWVVIKGEAYLFLAEHLRPRAAPSDHSSLPDKGLTTHHVSPLSRRERVAAERPGEGAPAAGPGSESHPYPAFGHPLPGGEGNDRRLNTPPPAPPVLGLDFARAFGEAFDRLDRRNGATNFVTLADLRRALAGFGRDEFDAGLRRLRLDGLYALDSHEGLHGSLTPEERAAGVSEAGSLLIYASRR